MTRADETVEERGAIGNEDADRALSTPVRRSSTPIAVAYRPAPDAVSFAPMPLENLWRNGPPPAADPLDQLVYLSNLVGRETALVQPGGGNSSIKIPGDGGTAERLLVKGSGTDLRTIGRAGFTNLSLAALAELGRRDSMDDPEMMRFMADCMIDRGGPVPSVETPLHSLLPHPVIVHTHDIATMSLTNLNDGVAERLVTELFEGEVAYVPYARPGFPLARLVSDFLERIPERATGLTLAHHGLVVWGRDAHECYENLVRVVGKIDAYVETARRGRKILGDQRPAVITEGERRRRAELLMPVIRGALGVPDRVVLHLDDADDMLDRLAAERFAELSQRGMTTPEHVLRAGRVPLWIDLDPGQSDDDLLTQARSELARCRAEYESYHARHATQGEPPIGDWAKVVLLPGIGMITAFKDKKSAVTANVCYRAGVQAIENAEALDAFQFLPESDVFQFERWPLERRKVEEAIAKERTSQLLPRHIVVVIGGGSGIGRAAAERFAREGANVVIADLDADASQAAAEAICERHPLRAIGVAVDVTDEASLDALFSRTVLEYGGLDTLFYTAGRAPRFATVEDITREDLQRQLDVHYIGAVLAIGRAAAIMRRQGLGGSIVASVSKAAVSPGKEAVAYGGSKAALLQALRVAAVELGEHGIRVNAINADQIETPMFRKFVEERAAARGISFADQLEAYRKRNVMGASLIPPEIVADLAVLLASDRFRYTTGDILTVDGGLPEAFPR